MKEDLNLVGNELNYMTIVFWSSYCTSMIPACYYLTRYPINIVLPVLEIGWGLSTFGLAWLRTCRQFTPCASSQAYSRARHSPE